MQVSSAGTSGAARPPRRLGCWHRAVSLLRRTLVAAALATPAGWVARAAWGLPTALGAHRRRLRPVVTGSSRFSDGKFHNTIPTPALSPANTRDGLLRQRHEERHLGLPGCAGAAGPPELPAEAEELAVTWFGHASALLEIDGRRVLVDPVWGYRVSPSPVFGPTRLHPAPIAAGGPAAGRRRRHLARPLRPPRPAHRAGAADDPDGAVRRARWASASTCASGACPRSASSSWTGTAAPPSPG